MAAASPVVAWARARTRPHLRANWRSHGVTCSLDGITFMSRNWRT